MRIKIAFLDCDGTLTKVKSSWEYLHRRLGIWDNLADHYQNLFRQGAISYHEFCARDAALWKGISVSRVSEIIEEIEYREHARELIHTLRSAGVYTAIISTGLSMVVERVRAHLSIDMAVSNELLSSDGLLTGETFINVEYNKKDLWVKKILGLKGMVMAEACALGDGEGDGGLFESVGQPIRIIGGQGAVSQESALKTCDSLYGAIQLLRGEI